MSDKDINVPLLADTPAEDNEVTTTAAALLLRAAKEDRLVSAVCHHHETGEEAVMLCIMDVDDSGKIANYTPAGMLFTPGNTPWVEYVPPSAGIELPKLEVASG